MKKPTYQEIAESYELWETYVDPDSHDSKDKFDSMDMEERLRFIKACFGPERVEADQ